MRKLFQLLVFVVLIACVNLFALTSGPTQPEYSSFEPVDATDLVDLGTGDFTYVLPLGEVKSPSGIGYPITLSYKAGILHEQEAAWVGLGWNLNAGAINRTVRGFPDDLCGEATLAYLYDEGDNGWDLSFGGGWKFFEATSTISYSSKKGYTLYPMSSISLYGGLKFGSNFMIGGKIGYNDVSGSGYALLNAGISDKSGSVTAGGSVGVTTDGQIFGGVGAGINTSGVSVTSFNLSTTGALGFSVLGSTAHLSSTDFSSSGTSQASNNMSIGLTIPYYGIDMLFDYTTWNWYYSQLQYGESYGYIYQGANPNDNISVANTRIGTNNELLSGFGVENSLKQCKVKKSANQRIIDPDIQYVYPKLEYGEIAGCNLPAKDIYNSVAQGLIGSFMPFSYYAMSGTYSEESKFNGIVGKPKDGNSGSIADPFEFDEFYNNVGIKNFGTRLSNDSGLIFKMINEAALNVIDNTELSYSLDNGYSNISEKVQGVKITPLIGQSGTNEFETKLQGFIIRDQEGKTYYYTLPLYSLGEYEYVNSESKVPVVSGTDIFSVSEGQHSYHVNLSPYAYTWLLTSITGPDFIKSEFNISNNQDKTIKDVLPKSGDKGYWTNFHYEYGLPTNADINDDGLLLDANKSLNKALYLWRLPYSLASSGLDTHIEDPCYPNRFKAKFGVKEITYLKSIETPTEVAYFETSERKDGKGIDKTNYPKIIPNPVDYPITEFSSGKGANRHFYGGLWKNMSTDLNVTSCMVDKNNCTIFEIPSYMFSSEDFWNGEHGKIISQYNFECKATWHKPSGDGTVGPNKRTRSFYLRKDIEGCTFNGDFTEITDISRGFNIDKETYSSLSGHIVEGYSGGKPLRIMWEYINLIKCVFAEDDVNTGMTYLYAVPYGPFLHTGERINSNSAVAKPDGSFYRFGNDGSPIAHLPSTRLEMAEELYDDHWNRQFIEITMATAFAGGLLSGQFAPYTNGNNIVKSLKKLNEIKWYSKSKYPLIEPLTLPESTIKPYKNVDFIYDYSLAKNTSNSISDEKGRLTLKGISICTGNKDDDNFQALPPYSFKYQKPDLTYLGFDRHDPWGFRDGDNFNDNKSGIAWNLSEITYPSGGKINIEYERDEGYSEVATLLKMKDECPDERKKYIVESIPGDYYNKIEVVNPQLYNGEKEIKLLHVNDIEPGDHFILRVEEKKEPIETSEKLIVDCPTSGNIHRYHYFNFMFNSFTVIDINKNTNTIYLDAPIHDWNKYDEYINEYFYDRSNGGRFYDRKIEVLFFKKGKFYGGDLRVKEISTTNSLGNCKTINYEYFNGYFPNLVGTLAPVSLTNNDTFSLYDSDLDRFDPQPEWGDEECYCSVQHGPGAISVAGNIRQKNHISRDPFQSFVGGTTRMLYPEVTVSQVDKDKSIFVGSTKYMFFSKNDLIDVNGELSKPIIEYSSGSGTYGGNSVKIQKIQNRSSIIGMPKKIEKFSKDDQVNPIFTKEMEYAFSEDLSTKAGVYYGELDDKISAEDKKPLGLIQERSMRREKENNYDVTVITDVINSKPFLIGIKETVDGVISEIKHGMFNAQTGKPSLTIVETSKAEKKAQVNIPYSSMPNMLPEEENIVEYKNTYTLTGGSFTVDVTDLSFTNLGDLTYSDLTNDINNVKQASTGLYYFDIYNSTTNFDAQQARCWIDTSVIWKGKDNTNTIFAFPTPGNNLPSNWLINSIIEKTDRHARPTCGLSPNSKSEEYTSSTVAYHPNMSAVTGVIANAHYQEASVLNGEYFDNQNIYNGYIDHESDWYKAASNDNSLADPKVELSDNETLFGQKCIYVKNAYGPTRNFKLEKGCDYIFSAWVKPVGSFEPSKPDMINVDYRRKVDGSPDWPISLKSTNVESPKFCSGVLDHKLKDNGWFFIELSVPFSTDISSSDYDNGYQYARVNIGAPNGGEVYINDIRFYPEDAIVKSFYYDQDLCMPIAFVDENNKVKRFSYDGFGRLDTIKNNVNEVLSSTEYYLSLNEGLAPINLTASQENGSQIVTFYWDESQFKNSEEFIYHLWINGYGFVEKNISGNSFEWDASPLSIEYHKNLKWYVIADDGKSHVKSEISIFEFYYNNDDRSRDSLALVELYLATGGDNWKSNVSGWENGVPINSWSGVSVSGDRVTSLKLSNPDIYDEQGNLVTRVPKLNGSIPKEFCVLSNLISLDLSLNELSGKIPSELYNMLNIKELILHSNELDIELTDEICKLEKLESLNLSSNSPTQDQTIPYKLCELPYLVYLDLSDLRLVDYFPANTDQTNNWNSLKYLMLGGGKWTDNRIRFTWNVYTAKNLVVLDISGNESNNITEEFANGIANNLTKLKQLDVSDNILSSNVENIFEDMAATQLDMLILKEHSIAWLPIENLIDFKEENNIIGNVYK